MKDNFSYVSVDKSATGTYNVGMVDQPNQHPHPVFISLSGKKQTGKDTAAGMAIDMLQTAGKRVGVTAFAEVLKNIAIDVLGLDRDLVYGSNEDKETLTHIIWDNFPEEIRFKYSIEKREESVSLDPLMGQHMVPMLRSGPMTIREVLQVMGTDIFREMFEQDIWANSPFRRDWSEYDVVLITDCRFPNEKRITEEQNGLVVRITRDTGLMDNHTSETILDDVTFDVFYSNEGTIDELRDFMRNLLRQQGLLECLQNNPMSN